MMWVCGVMAMQHNTQKPGAVAVGFIVGRLGSATSARVVLSLALYQGPSRSKWRINRAVGITVRGTLCDGILDTVSMCSGGSSNQAAGCESGVCMYGISHDLSFLHGFRKGQVVLPKAVSFMGQNHLSNLSVR